MMSGVPEVAYLFYTHTCMHPYIDTCTYDYMERESDSPVFGRAAAISRAPETVIS